MHKILYDYLVACATLSQMPRKRTTVTIDERAIKAIKAMATEVGATFPRYLETLMVSHAKEGGKLPEDYRLIGETRGGNRAVMTDRLESTGQKLDQISCG